MMACSKEDNNDNLETFSIWWLDTEVNNEENRIAQKKLRGIINDLKTWEHPNEFEEYVRRMSTDDRVVLIVSGRMGRQIVPRIHPLRQVSLIYVYCFDKKANEQWAREYSKVKGVYIELNELISHIQCTHKYFIKSEEPLPISIFEVGKTMTGINGQFLNFQLLIEILFRMKSNEIDQKEFISMCKKKYKDNVEYLRVTEEFDKKYKSEEALEWYTRETYIYKILNKSLRKQNIDVLVLLHSFIKDIRRQLRKYQCEQSILVYRGQKMSSNELSSYQNSNGNFISINSFFSTSLSKEKAIQFAISNDYKLSTKTSINSEVKSVLFEINADPKVVINTKRPFADISSVSCSPSEAEVLFTVGSIFRLDEINLDSLQYNGQIITVIRMTLCGDQQHELHEVYHCMRKDYGNGTTDLRSLGTLLGKMGKLDLAEKYYHKMLTQLSPNDGGLADLYNSLGIVAAEKNEIDKSLDWYQKSLKIKMQTNPSGHVSLCKTYSGIGIVLQKIGDLKQALQYFNKAISLFQQAHDENHVDMGGIYHNIGVIYNAQHMYTKALEFYEKSVANKRKHLPSSHPDFAISYNTMGYAYQCLGHCDAALERYHQSLDINLKVLAPEHPHIAMNYRNIGLTLVDKGEVQQGLKCLKKARKIYRHSFPSNSPEVVNIDKAIEHVLHNF